MRVLTTIRRAEYFELIVLFFIQAMAMGMWFVPLSPVLDAHGYHDIKPFAFTTAAVAAFVSPLIFGAMADRHAPPLLVLRWLSVATAAAMVLATAAIQTRCSAAVVLGAIQLHALCNAPTFSISTAVVFSRLRDSQREYGPIRAMATLGWMVGCWGISLMNADASPRAGYVGALVWLGVAAYTVVLPQVAPAENPQRLTWQQRLGWDALTLLRHPDHRVVFITAALFNATVACLFPFTPPHLQELGFTRVTAWMSLAQVSEIIAMFLLAGLLTRWRLKWIFLLGLGLSALRYGLCALNTPLTLLAGLSLHGATFSLVLITSQIYLEQRIDPNWRTRAQALHSLMASGVGNLIGFLGTGAWMAYASAGGAPRWGLFWSGIGLAVSGVLVYFLVAYHGRGVRPGEGRPAGGDQS
jgi:MFS family permease